LSVLRGELLHGHALLLAGPPTPLAAALSDAFAALGARVCTCLPDGTEESAIDSEVARALPLDTLIVEGAGLFAGAPNSLRACLDSAWNVTRAVVNHAFLPAGEDRTATDRSSGRIVYLAPPADAGEHAAAARAGLENLARTLSIEWARYRINVLTIAAGSCTTPQEIATLAAYLASPAGEYFSGCLLTLR
jgi:citronellol/citronellal dehydrogenase